MKKTLTLLCAILLLAACNENKTSVINGQFHGTANKLIALERLSPVGGTIVDTTQTSSDGKFSFEIDFTDITEPTFFNIRLNDQFVPLLIDKGEVVQVSSLGNIFFNYKVSGSAGSELLNRFNKQIITSNLKLDSLGTLYNAATDNERSVELGRELSREYVKMKQMAVAFVMRNASSLAVIVPLFQPLYNGRLLFDDPKDVIYYRAVADSLAKYYPNSAYLTSLRNDIKRVDNIYAVDSMLNSISDQVINFPEINIKDASGKDRKLSEEVNNTKVILLSFTSSREPALKIINRELVDIYTKYHAKGFQIFEVSIDSDRASWLRSVTDNKLPWIQTCDFAGAQSAAVIGYNVKGLPSNFLITNGAISAKNLTSEQLDVELAKLLKE